MRKIMQSFIGLLLIAGLFTACTKSVDAPKVGSDTKSYITVDGVVVASTGAVTVTVTDWSGIDLTNNSPNDDARTPVTGLTTVTINSNAATDNGDGTYTFTLGALAEDAEVSVSITDTITLKDGRSHTFAINKVVTVPKTVTNIAVKNNKWSKTAESNTVTWTQSGADMITLYVNGDEEGAYQGAGFAGVATSGAAVGSITVNNAGAYTYNDTNKRDYTVDTDGDTTLDTTVTVMAIPNSFSYIGEYFPKGISDSTGDAKVSTWTIIGNAATTASAIPLQ